MKKRTKPGRKSKAKTEEDKVKSAEEKAGDAKEKGRTKRKIPGTSAGSSPGGERT